MGNNRRINLIQNNNSLIQIRFTISFISETDGNEQNNYAYQQNLHGLNLTSPLILYTVRHTLVTITKITKSCTEL